MRTVSIAIAMAIVVWGAAAHAAGVSFAGAVQPIFDANCVACHQSGAASQGLNLESGRSYAAVVNRRSSEADTVSDACPHAGSRADECYGAEGSVGRGASG